MQTKQRFEPMIRYGVMVKDTPETVGGMFSIQRAVKTNDGHTTGGGMSLGYAYAQDIAELWAAAPELLAALEFIVNDVPEPGEDAQLTANGYNMACAAILKARGES